MSQVFDADPNSRVFDEISRLSSQDTEEGIRLNPLDSVSKQITSSAAKLVVSKPLVESHRITELLDFFPNSRAIWMFRHYKDVTRSNLLRWGDGNGFSDLEPIVNSDLDKWRAAGLEPETVDLIKDNWDAGLTAPDAAALFWYSRNTHFFRQKLEADSRVLLVRYEDLVHSPVPTFEKIYRFVDQQYPGDSIVGDVSTSSIGKGAELEFTSSIEELCDSMLEQLDSTASTQ